jgi:hypothetical protein
MTWSCKIPAPIQIELDARRYGFGQMVDDVLVDRIWCDDVAITLRLPVSLVLYILILGGRRHGREKLGGVGGTRHDPGLRLMMFGRSTRPRVRPAKGRASHGASAVRMSSGHSGLEVGGLPTGKEYRCCHPSGHGSVPSEDGFLDV